MLVPKRLFGYETCILRQSGLLIPCEEARVLWALHLFPSGPPHATLWKEDEAIHVLLGPSLRSLGSSARKRVNIPVSKDQTTDKMSKHQWRFHAFVGVPKRPNTCKFAQLLSILTPHAMGGMQLISPEPKRTGTAADRSAQVLLLP